MAIIIIMLPLLITRLLLPIKLLLARDQLTQLLLLSSPIIITTITIMVLSQCIMILRLHLLHLLPTR
jgi:hypothetical protein